MVDPHWYQSYFDDAVLRLYRSLLDPEEARRETAAILDWLGLPLGANVLDVGCGWGRHALLLAEAGLEVTGVDLSPAALIAAAASAREAGLSIRWESRDMRVLGFEAEFDAALSLFSSLGYFLSDDEDLRVLQGIRRALRPGGLLLLETMHRDSFVSGFQPRERWEGVEGGPVEVERDFDPVAGVNRERLTWPDGRVKEHAMRIRTATEWVRLLEAAGFEIRELFGGWEEEPLLPTSPVLLLLARREGEPADSADSPPVPSPSTDPQKA
jgi:SAM-dependent methyltransferase